MKPEMLHYQSMNNQQILISNDSDYLKDHSCPGLFIKNIMYIPVFINDTKPPIAVISIANTLYKNGYQLNMAKTLQPLINLVSLILSSSLKLRKQLDDERKYLIKNQQQITDMSAFIIRNSKEMAAIFTSDGNLLVSSPGFDEGMSTIAEGKKTNFKCFQDFKDNENTEDIYNYLIKVNSGEPTFIHVMQTFRTPSSKIYIDATYGSIFSQDKNNPIGTYIMAKNITNNKILEEKLRSTTEDLKKALKDKDVYMSRISHELRTPLNSIFGFSQLIDIGCETGDDIEQDWARTILKSSEHLLRLIDEVLDLSKAGSDNIKLSMEDVSLGDLIHEVVQMLHTESEKMNLSIKLEADKSCGYIYVDRHRMNQVLANVISNAIKYNKQNGKIDIRIEKRPFEKVCILIIDSGIGISENRIVDIGTPFDRLGMEDSNIEGSGLGLALSIALLKQMNCEFHVSSKKNCGTTVSLICPAGNINKQNESLSHGFDGQDIKYLSIGKTLNHPVHDDKIVILYIEDNITNFRLMETIVEKRMKLKIVVASQGRRGLDIAKSMKPSLVILDLGLPDMSGIEVLYELKSCPETYKIPVVIFSADANPSTINVAMEMGAENYLTKPTRIELLEKEILKYTNPAEQKQNKKQLKRKNRSKYQDIINNSIK
jgi:signal transduction histidine kinase/CheY-like chemotaxis protein